MILKKHRAPASEYGFLSLSCDSDTVVMLFGSW